jgi:hypothetical protein
MAKILIRNSLVNPPNEGLLEFLSKIPNKSGEYIYETMRNASLSSMVQSV